MQFSVADSPLPESILIETRALPFQPESHSHPAVYRPQESDSPKLYAFLNDLGIGFPLQHVQVNRFKPGDQNPWHHDGNDPAIHVIAMLYLTADSFDESDGGYLEFGYRKGDPTQVGIHLARRIVPAHGRLVLIHDTHDTQLVHRVEPLRAPKERYSVVAFFGTGKPTSA